MRQSAIADNAWAVINYGPTQVDAPESWWGSPAPADAVFGGDVARSWPVGDAVRGP